MTAGEWWRGAGLLAGFVLILVAFGLVWDIPARSAAASCGDARCVNLLFDGDSISAGWGATGRKLDQLAAAALGGDVRLHNVAEGGRPVIACLQRYDALVAPFYDRSVRRNVIAFHAGDNDIAAGRSAAETYAAFTDYVAAAHRQGWRVVVSTELRRADFPPEAEDQLERYNALLRQNRAGAEAVVDLDTDAKLRDFAYRHDPRLFTPDGIHPNDGGYAVIAAMLAPAVRRVAGG
jgi:lysophospholipase L1-like esterase